MFLTPFGGLEAEYDVHPRLIGKPVVDFLLVIIKLFVGAIVQALQANIGWKSPFLMGWVTLAQKFG